MVQSVHRVELLWQITTGYRRGYESSSGSAAGLLVVLAIIFGLYLLLGVAFGFGGRAIMRSKGRSGGAGFALGFFLGVIGLVIAAVMTPSPEHEAERFRHQMLVMGGNPGGLAAQPGAFSPQPGVPTSGVGPTSRGGTVPSANIRNLLVVGAGAIVLSTILQFVGAWVNSFTAWRVLSWLSCAVGLAAAALCIAAITGKANTEPREQLPSWWQPTVIAAGALAGLFALLRPSTSRVHDTTVIFAQPLVFIAGTAVAVLALARAQRTGARIAAIWVGVVLLRTIASKVHFLPYFKYRLEALSLFPRYWGQSGVWTILALLATLALGGLAVWVGFIRSSTVVSAAAAATPAVATPYQQTSPRPAVNLGGIQEPPAGALSAGWVADPFGRNEYRYWDGATWTDQVANGGVMRTDPATVTPAQPQSDPTAQTERPWQAAATPVPSIADRWGAIESDKTVVIGAKQSPLELFFDNGARALVNAMLVVGRQPAPVPTHPDADLFQYDDPNRMVSKSHFAIGKDDLGVWVEDLASANGTIVVDGLGGERRLEPNQRTRVDVGSVVRFADQWVRINPGS